MSAPFSFEVVQQADGSRARLGRLVTPHGVIETPAFMFCATRGTLKAAGPEDLELAGAQVMLANTYHLMLRPGSELVEKLGGLHRFSGWSGPIFTDSGGFQVFSLGHGSVADEIKGRRNQAEGRKSLLKITEHGALFKSYVDGAQVLLTPERAIEIQRQLGSDLVVVLDECTPYHVDRDYTERSMERTHRWADRCLTEFERHDQGKQALYGIVQGGVYEDLRHRAAEFVSSRPFFAHAIGGSLGAEKSQMYDVVEMTQRVLSPQRPVHLLGIGGVDDIFHGVERGIDTFDCVAPTRMARHGWALCREAPHWRLNLTNARFREDESPLEADCDCRTCRRHSRAFLHYLAKADELQGMFLVTVHNLHFMMRLLRQIRAALAAGTFMALKREWLGTGASA
jgi:queuine tRNA-ribosyltransferase